MPLEFELEIALQKHKQVLARLENLHHDRIIAQTQLQSVALDKESIEREKIEIERQKDSIEQQQILIDNKLKHVLHHAPWAVIFICSDGKLYQDHRCNIAELLGDCSQGNEFATILSASCNNKQSQQLQLWFRQILKNLPKPGRLTPPLDTLPFIADELVVKYLQFTFIVTDQLLQEANLMLMAFVQDVTQHQNLRQENEIAFEIATADASLVKNFIEEIADYLQTLQENLHKLQANERVKLIRELNQQVQAIKSNARFIKFKAIISEAEKLGTLLQIIENIPGNLSLKHVMEIKALAIPFVDLLAKYIKTAQRFLKTIGEENTPMQNDAALDSAERILFNTKFAYLTYAGLSGTSLPTEIVEYMEENQKFFHKMLPESGVRYRLFEFVDVLEFVINGLRTLSSERKVVFDIAHEQPRVLLYGDYGKTIELLEFMLHASLLRAELTSGLKITSTIIPQKGKADFLELETRVTIRNTEQKTLTMLKSWFAKWKKFLRECGGELNGYRWGFRLQIPLVVNKFFPSPVRIALISKQQQSLENCFQKVTPWFPFDLEIVPSPADYRDFLAIIAEAKALATIGPHIQNKLEQLPQPVSLVALVNKNDGDLLATLLQYGISDFLSSSPTGSDLRWCLLNCMNTFAHNQRDRWGFTLEGV